MWQIKYTTTIYCHPFSITYCIGNMKYKTRSISPINRLSTSWSITCGKRTSYCHWLLVTWFQNKTMGYMLSHLLCYELHSIVFPYLESLNIQILHLFFKFLYFTVECVTRILLCTFHYH